MSQERDAQWTDSSDSLHKQQSPVTRDHQEQPGGPCLESVNLNSNLAIRLSEHQKNDGEIITHVQVQ